MAVFISYARADELHAERVAALLRAEGYEVWRDDELPAHRPFSEVIEERLREAAAVVVLWSDAAGKSEWVRAEADTARESRKLIQAQLDRAPPPLPFNQIQCADLRQWEGGQTSGWRKLLESVAALAGDPSKMNNQRKTRRENSVCVLPFLNMSGDAEQEYFSDGIAEDITTDLSKVSALEVIARNTAFQFKGKSVDVGEIARKLNVSHVLEGSVRKAGSRVRITAQLIERESGSHVWAERYDRDLTDIFAIQDEISKAIVDVLKVKLLPLERQAIERRGTTNVEAYNLYLMARQFWIAGNYGDVRRDQIVVRTVEHAIELDPAYGKAWALMAIAQASLRYHHGRIGDDGVAAADKALALDPTIAEAYAVRARHFAERGDYQLAEAEVQAGLNLDPNSWDLVREAARLAMAQRKVAEAKQSYIRAAALDENDFHSAMMLTTCYIDEGDRDAAKDAARMMLERAERAAAQDPQNASAIGITAGALALLGRVEDAKDKHRRAMLIDPENVNMPYNFACVLAAWLGESEAALDLLEPLFARLSQSLVIGAVADPDMDSLRDHPRFIAAAKAAIVRTGITPEMLPETARALAQR